MSASESYGAGHYALYSSPAAVATSLSGLRQYGLPRAIEPPRFRAPAQAAWLLAARRSLSRYALIAGSIAALVLVVATVIPAWAALQSGDAAAPLSAVRSSAGVTGTPGTRVADLGAATFLGGIPFVQQSQRLGAAAGSASAPQRFVMGARQASVGDYVEQVSVQVALPYLNDTASTKESVEAWNAELAQQQAAAQAAPYVASFQPALPAPGTVIPAARATFYSCIGNGFCGVMANGQQVVEGAAACSADLPFGTRFFLNDDPTQRVFTCLDRGALAATWVDVWFYDAADGWAWQAMLGGTYSDITIVQ